MLNILKNYSDNGSFILNLNENLKSNCNAPKDKCGVYLIYNITNKKELIYIGCTGHITNKGEISIRKTGGGGIYGRIVNGHQFGKLKRWESIPKQMLEEKIIKLEFEWYSTFNETIKHSPIYTESTLLQNYYELNGKLPKWNKKF